METVVASVPLLVLLGTGLLLMLVDAFRGKALLPWLAAAGIIASAALGINDAGRLPYQLHFNNMIAFGGAAAGMHVVLCAISLLTLFFLTDYMKRRDSHHDADEIYALLLFAMVGMVLLATANDLIMVFIGLEVMSICLYIMAGLFPKNLRSNESGLKYFLLGAFATGFLLFGMALLYGITGSTQLDVIGNTIFQEKAYALLSTSGGSMGIVLLFTALGLTLIGFLFKLAAFPFHSWTPDVYTGAPTPLTGFMATGTKLATFMALIFFLVNVTLRPEWDSANYEKLQNILGFAAIASMLYGNLVALQQKNIKRMLAYSSIAHTGYLMLGLMSGKDGYEAVVFYMIVYTLMTVGAFGIIGMLERKDSDTELSQWAGLGLRKPLLGVLMSAFLFSMAGIPPLGGFIAKYKIFSAAMHADLYLLSIVGILSSVIGAYYYLNVIVVMYFKPSPVTTSEGLLGDDTTLRRLLPYLGVILMGIGILAMGVVPGPINDMVSNLYAQVGKVVTP